MLASNFLNIQNLFLFEEMEKLVANETVNQAQVDSLKGVHPITKTNNNLLVRIGFFFLGVFLISSIIGFMTLFVAISGGADAFAIISLLMALCCIFASETLFTKNYFAYGLDDASVLAIPLFLAIGFGIATEEVHLVLFMLFAGSLFGAIRYVNVPATFFAVFFLVGFLGFTLVNDSTLSSSLLPFVMLFLGLGLYALQWKLKSKTEFFIYQNVLLTVEVLSLLLIYASMNYYVVRELSIELMNRNDGKEIPLAFLFYGMTFLIPLLYIYFGLKCKNRIVFWMGLLTIGLAFATIRYYHALMPIEYAFLLAGTVLFVVVYFSINKLKGKTSGLTFQEDTQLHPVAFDLVKTILINANAPTVVPVKSESPMTFGGGGFSGGGSGGNY